MAIWEWIISLNSNVTAVTSFAFSFAAMIISYASYKHSRDVALDDFKIKYQDIFLDIEAALEKSERFLVDAKKSRISMLAANGRYHSGSREIFEKNILEQEDKLKDLKSKILNNPNPKLKDLLNLKAVRKEVLLVIDFCVSSLEEDKISGERMLEIKKAFSTREK